MNEDNKKSIKPIETDVLTMEGAMELTGFKKSRLYALISAKRIPHYKVGQTTFFSKKELESWIFTNRISEKG